MVPGSVVSAPATGVQASQAPVAAAIAVAVTGTGLRNVAMRVMSPIPLVVLDTPVGASRSRSVADLTRASREDYKSFIRAAAAAVGGEPGEGAGRGEHGEGLAGVEAVGAEAVGELQERAGEARVRGARRPGRRPVEPGEVAGERRRVGEQLGQRRPAACRWRAAPRPRPRRRARSPAAARSSGVVEQAEAGQRAAGAGAAHEGRERHGEDEADQRRAHPGEQPPGDRRRRRRRAGCRRTCGGRGSARAGPRARGRRRAPAGSSRCRGR